MRGLYSSPFRVYVFFGLFGLFGVISGMNLPISLFPNTAKPQVFADVRYGSLSPVEFLDSYGRELESSLRALNRKDMTVEKVVVTYDSDRARYQVDFDWGVQPDLAITETRNLVQAAVASLAPEVRQSVQVYTRNDSGFFAASFYSEKRDLESVYKILQSMFSAELAGVQDASEAVVWNPAQKEIQIELKPEIMANLQLLPGDVSRAVLGSIESYGGGSVQVGEQNVSVTIPRASAQVNTFSQIPIVTNRGTLVQLKDVAKVELTTPLASTRVIKTSGASSVMIWAEPKPAGNIKRMSEDIVKIINSKMASLPPDIQYKMLVDPSEFIRSSVHNVMREVALAAGLAVLVLFFFIGSLKNVITAAIEIPLSLVMAFILMRLAGMNLNLISLGGLALSAGMNVDASVVVMENIFRHFESVKGKLSAQEKLEIVVRAVDEVKLPIIASTIASLVVFLPLIFTKGLGAAILGDLAKAVVFSHGLSAVVALILVPTVRLHMMRSEEQFVHHSVFDKYFVQLENAYGRWLDALLGDMRKQRILIVSVVVAAIAVVALVVPRTPKEIIGEPESDRLMLFVNTQGNTMIRQMETQTDEIEARALNLLGEKVTYTFVQIWQANRSMIIFRLQSRRQMPVVWKALETEFSNTPQFRYFIKPWNPSEMRLPDPPHFRVSVRGGDSQQQAAAAKEISDLLQEAQTFPRVSTDPDAELKNVIMVRPSLDLGVRNKLGTRITTRDIGDISRVATSGAVIGYFPYENELTRIFMKFPDGFVKTVEDYQALPIGVADRLLPLKAFANVSMEKQLPTISRENQMDIYYINGKQNRGDEKEIQPSVAKAEALVKKWQTEHPQAPVVVRVEDPNPDLKESLQQLSWALGVSALLILVTMIMQLGNVVNSLLVFLAVPLGLIGAFLSLFIFRSTISLNSLLGLILLSGIAVANSIILVDFLQRLVDSGMKPREAAVKAATTRLRPILMTSMTTMLGMLPVAIGAGEGGKILQPLGVSVTGGLWISMLLTLFVVPALQVAYLEKVQSIRLSSAAKVLAGIVLAVVFASAPAGAATFEEELSTFVERDQSVAIQKSRLRSAEISLRMSRWKFTPDLQLSASRGSQGDPSADIGSQKISSNLNLFRFGADYDGVSASKAAIEAEEQTLLQTELSVEAQAATFLLTYLSKNLEESVLQRDLRAHEEYARVAKQRFDQGYLSRQELDKVRIDLSNAQARVADTTVDKNNALVELTSGLGHAPTLNAWPWQEYLAQNRDWQATVDLQKHPLVRASQAQLQQSEAEASAARASILPRFDLSAYHEWTQYKGAETRSWAGLVTLTVPLWSRTQDLGAYRLAMESRTRADSSLQRQLKDVQKSFDKALNTFSTQIRSTLLRQETLSTTRQLYEDNVRRFQAGRASVNDLLLDQERLTQAELLAVQGWRSAHLSWLALCHSRGLRAGSCRSRY